MKKIDFGQMVGLLANIGVVAGIVLLAIECSIIIPPLQRGALFGTEIRSF